MPTTKRKLLVLGLLLCHFGSSYSLSTEDLPYYDAGVVEFSWENNASSNLLQYINIIHSEDAKQLDIIVFPEMTLSTSGSLIPNPEDKIVPCGNEAYDSIIQGISCSAIDSSVYVVVNIHEKSECTKESQATLNDNRPCALNGLNIYNTNVVFDRNGTVVSRYRKFNLFGELGVNTTLASDISTFQTDFGVTFGHFICFDLLFYTPAFRILSMDITDIIFPAMWFSQLPFLTAVQIQQSWAYANDVNLLAAGADKPNVGNTGSGIYNGRNGSLVVTINTQAETKLLTARVPKISRTKRSKIVPIPINQPTLRQMEIDLLDIFLKREFTLDNFTTIELDLTQSESHERLCHNELCCDIELKINPRNSSEMGSIYRYRLFAYEGERIFSGVRVTGVATCGIFACTNNTLASCGHRLNATDLSEPSEQIEFQEINVSGSFEGGPFMFTMPNSLSTDLMPLEQFKYDESEEFLDGRCLRKSISHKIAAPTSDLLTFAIYGRNFRKDDEFYGQQFDQQCDSAQGLLLSKFVVFVLVIRFLINL
ncbi:vanin-like protein 1 [Bradysia coprophila]|uniref:vanin-like protein 1 n=1 Tax=Bradysia coprophila TaxID=38358 RepID=UPI00187DD8CC|nr:vanin-like protein 1 [Bradysia coprophila]